MGSKGHKGTKHSHPTRRKRQGNRPFRSGALTVLVVNTINADHIGKSKSFTMNELREKLRRQGRNLLYLSIVMNKLEEAGAISFHSYTFNAGNSRLTRVYYAKKKVAYRPNRHTRSYLRKYNLAQ